MRLKFFLRFVMFCCFTLTWSINHASDFRIEIRGTFPGANGQVIRLMDYLDQVSYLESEITADTIGESETFILSFSRFEPQYVFFRIDHARMGFFVEPGTTYELLFDPVDFTSLDDRRNPYLDPWHFPFNITYPEKDLNFHINSFEDIFNVFLAENFASIYQTRNRQLFIDFRLKMDSVFSDIQNPYFKNYYNYKFSHYYRIANIERFDRLFSDNIFNHPVLYQNTQYMNFFHTIFDTWVFAGSRNITITDLRHTVNNLNSYGALMDSLGKDTLLRNEVLREMAMLKALQDMHGNPDYSRENVRSILKEVADISKFPQHRQMAANILNKLSHLTIGTPAPPVILNPEDFDPIEFPTHFKGKFIYLGFWATWCETCMIEHTALRELFAKYSNDFVFVSVSNDRRKDQYERFLELNTIPGENFYFHKDFRMLDKYQVRSLPAFVIIDPEGNIASFPALKPGDNVALIFDWLIYQRSRQ